MRAYACVSITNNGSSHFQLSQFVGEVRKSPHGDSVRLVALGSRQNLCVNERVNRLKSVSLINERCQELREGKKAKSSEVSASKNGADDGDAKKKAAKGCPFYKQEAIEVILFTVYPNWSDCKEIKDFSKL